MKLYTGDYYSNHTDHYQKLDLALIPSFTWIKNALHPLRNEKILDAGCGTGYLLNFITSKTAVGIGIDISEDAINTARNRYPHLIFKTGELTKLPFADNSFDKIICFNVIEHIGDQDKSIQELVRILK